MAHNLIHRQVYLLCVKYPKSKIYAIISILPNQIEFFLLLSLTTPESAFRLISVQREGFQLKDNPSKSHISSPNCSPMTLRLNGASLKTSFICLNGSELLVITEITLRVCNWTRIFCVKNGEKWKEWMRTMWGNLKTNAAKWPRKGILKLLSGDCQHTPVVFLEKQSGAILGFMYVC